MDGRDLRNDTVEAATIATTLNACRSRMDPREDLRFAASPLDTAYSNRVKFGKPALDTVFEL